jgi:hypothetical protein
MTYSLDANHHDLNRDAMRLGIIVVDNAKVKRHEPDQLDVWWGIPNPYGGSGVWVWVEYKTPGGELRLGQERRIMECREAGLPVEVVRDTADVERVYNKYLGIMIDVV